MWMATLLKTSQYQLQKSITHVSAIVFFLPLYIFADHTSFNLLWPSKLVTPYGDMILINIVAGDGFLPDGTKPLPNQY